MFVRTSNNEIIDLSYCRYFEEEHRYWNGADCYSFEECEIIKQADTVEELCDVAVIVGKRYNEPYHWWFLRHKGIGGNNLVEIVKNYLELWGNEDYMAFESVYGAIWTNKGLIYVAKMNEKGELELL